MKQGSIIKVSGPLVVAGNMTGVKMYDVVLVGDKRLIGEVIELKEDRASIQVYEETGGVGPGEPVVSTDSPLSVDLGPGLISSIFDGVQRPLDIIRDKTGDWIPRGVNVPSLDRKKEWNFVPVAKIGDKVTGGDVLGTVQETSLVLHKIMVPVDVEGEVVIIHKGKYNIEQTVAEIKESSGKESVTHKICMLQKWPVRRVREYKEKIPTAVPLVTGQRVIDTLFPVTKGGTASIPGPFGCGKTVVLHMIAKWADADIIVYVGCGERGNEMADVLLEFPKLVDPRTGESLIKRTILIANTSNMPVAAREASIYTGITLAEYYRDMGYNVALMADSTSRWAEALREMSSRLEEMPGEEGYPAYLSSRLASFYERSGRVICIGNEDRQGTLSIMGAVSPPGGDFSDPVVQATLRIVKVFWGLDSKLAYMRHFPSINWLKSYSLYIDNIEEYIKKEVAKDYLHYRSEAMKLLQEEASLEEIVRLVGVDALSPEDRLTLETAKTIREDFLHQNAFDPVDVYTSLNKQYRMLSIIMILHHESEKALKEDVPFKALLDLKVKYQIARMKFIPEKDIKKFDELDKEVQDEIKALKDEQLIKAERHKEDA